jgi:hypothetical protein
LGIAVILQPPAAKLAADDSYIGFASIGRHRIVFCGIILALSCHDKSVV